jgi:hypothetical protein
MKIREYNQMMRYLTSTGEFAKNRKIEVKPKKTDVLTYINKMQEMYEGTGRGAPTTKQVMTKVSAKSGGVIKDPTFTKYNNGGTAKNKKNIKKENVKLAMSETPEEEAEMMLGGEAIEFMKWLKKNPDKTYNDWLKDKTAFLTEEQKKDKKIIDLTPFLPSFEEELERMEKEKDKEEKETLEDFILRRSKEMRLAEADSVGIPQLLAVKR